MLLTCQSLSAEVKIIKLNYAEPDSVILTLNQLFGKKVKVAAAPMINAVVINSDDKDVLAAIDQLIRDLDHRPALLRFSGYSKPVLKATKPDKIRLSP
jgi:type II secretory pathway component GspD/PulD (secretin)